MDDCAYEAAWLNNGKVAAAARVCSMVRVILKAIVGNTEMWYEEEIEVSTTASWKSVLLYSPRSGPNELNLSIS